jgi:integrase
MAFTDAFRRASDKAGLIGITLHMLRHTAATWLLSSGADPKTTSAILGQDPSTTLRIYSHVVVERQRSAIELIDQTLGPFGRTSRRSERRETKKPRSNGAERW